MRLFGKDGGRSAVKREHQGTYVTSWSTHINQLSRLGGLSSIKTEIWTDHGVCQ